MEMIKLIPIKEIGCVVTGKTPTTSVSENFGGDYMFVTPLELHTDFVIRESQKTLTRQGLDNIRSNSIRGLSIAVGCIGWDMGNVALIEEECATNQQINSITNIKQEHNPYYLYYWLLTKKKYLFQIATVTRTPILNKTTFEDVLVPMPLKEVQDRVVSLLLPISKKIALNNAINAELEKAAKLLYNYWFVQFDFPNVEGKPYRTSGGEMVYSEQLKHEIPQGWSVDTLKSLTNIVLGGTPSTANDEYWGEEFYWLNSGEVANFPIVTTELKVTQTGIDNSATKLMPVGTTVVSITGNIRASILGIESCANQSVVGIYETEKTKHTYLYPVISNLLKKYTALSTGNCQTHINKGTIEDTVIVIPPDDVMDKYNAVCLPIYKKIFETALENKELTALLDFLLPLLMNGQVTVAGTEAAVPVATAPAVNDAKAKQAAVFKRLVLSAYLLDNICDEPTAGRVKFEKLLYLSEHCARLPLQSEFHRAAAGPYDAQALYSIENQLQKNKWFKRQKISGESRAYSRLAKVNGYKPYISTNLDERQKGVIDNLIHLFKSTRTMQCEIVATLYGAWNDFLIDGVQPTDGQIVDEVLTNWHESKERIDRSRWLATLGWMRDNSIVPIGYGMSTKSHG